jgi:CheY-like chemotaxis protein
VAKILVADDNSNIQKMVGLALKDQGIDVVAVGNGEAAVRKISDIKPDLVLADVFMPVRNGYEVCKYVKDDEALKHIPVILLVGAFDPLDEQEAQRVGADGVLKKPFVPPDPLISMVKSALQRAGVSLTKEPPPAPKVEPPPIPSMPKIAAAPPSYLPEPEEEPPAAATFSTRPAPMTFESNTQPFGNLTDSPAIDDDAVFAVSPNASIAAERNWGSTEEEEEEVEDEESSTASWRVSSMDDAVAEAPAGKTDWREAAFAELGSEKKQTGNSEDWAPSIEKDALSITEEEAAALARKQESIVASLPSRAQADWTKAIQEVLPEKTETVEQYLAPVVEEEKFVPPPPPPPPMPQHLAPVSETKPEATQFANSWMAGAVSPWEAEIQRASQLNSTWDNGVATQAAVAEPPGVTETHANSEVLAASESRSEIAEHLKTAEDVVTTPEAARAVESLLSSETQEILHEETAQVISEQAPSAIEALESAAKSAVAAPPTAPPNMDEVVAKILAKLNPEVLQAVTREILKPVVEAMVKEELQKK